MPQSKNSAAKFSAVLGFQQTYLAIFASKFSNLCQINFRHGRCFIDKYNEQEAT